jgi:hypothetical protein
MPAEAWIEVPKRRCGHIAGGGVTIGAHQASVVPRAREVATGLGAGAPAIPVRSVPHTGG